MAALVVQQGGARRALLVAVLEDGTAGGAVSLLAMRTACGDDGVRWLATRGMAVREAVASTRGGGSAHGHGRRRCRWLRARCGGLG